MKLTKGILDKKISECEVNGLEMTYREWIREIEDEYEFEHKDLDSLSDEELDEYDTFLWELELK